MRSTMRYFRETSRILLPLAILAAGVGVFAAISRRDPPDTRVSPDQRPPMVETTPVGLYDGTFDLEADGVVVPYREITLTAEVAGRISFKNASCRAGQYVRKGERLFGIDARTYELEVVRLKTEVEQAGADLNELSVERENARQLMALAESQLALERRSLARAKELNTTRVTTDAEVDKALQGELTVRNALSTLANQMRTIDARQVRLELAKELAAARLAQAELDLERTQVASPVDGVVVNEMAEQDNYVQQGTALVAIEDTSAVEVQCSLRAEELSWILEQSSSLSPFESASDPQAVYKLPATPVTIVYQAGPQQYAWSGKLSRYDGIGVDLRTRMTPVRVVVPEPRSARLLSSASTTTLGPPRALVRGMFVKVILHVQPRQPLLTLPERAIQPGKQVWRMRDGRIRIASLSSLRMLDGKVVFQQGDGQLAAGDRVVISPLSAPIDGMAVREAAPDEAPSP